MDATVEAILQSWPLDPWVVLPLLAAAALYTRGWLTLRRRGALRFDARHLAAFHAGLASLFLALASPLEPFAALLLQVHMVQHLLLMIAAPLLLLLGEPPLPLLRGLPGPVRRAWVAPLLREPAVRACFRRLTSLPLAWGLSVAATWVWHVPALYDLALASPGWHRVEHACFFATGCLFWWPVVLPYPARPHGSRWALLPYLVLAGAQGTVLSAILTFSDRVLYAPYEALPRLGSLSALDDQAAAGVIMWVPGSLALLVAVVCVGVRLLSGRDGEAAFSFAVNLPTTARAGAPRRIPLPVFSATSQTGCGPQGVHPPRSPEAAALSWDLLRLPLLGRFLKWRHARLSLQVPLFALAAGIVLDGWFGPPVAAMNLAGVLPWVHWRGLVVLILLTLGNVFCMACPFLLPRTLARRWLPRRRRWPRLLRSKWPAVVLLGLFFVAYEVFALWASPWWTAWLIVGYFLAAFAVDGLFEGASFCKYVCPVGQFQFVQSLVSPVEVRALDPATCLRCTGKECLRGSAAVSGCELHLFLPRKSGNLDCTFCLDCAHACPHDNVGITAVVPGADLLHDRSRSGVGRFSQRPDLAALVLVFVFAAFANAAAMVAPVVAAEEWLADSLGMAGVAWVQALGLAAALVVLPVLLVGTAARLGSWWSGDAGTTRTLATRFSFALAPLGAGMWLAHYSFHFFGAAAGLLPVVQRAALDLGVPGLGPPEWRAGCCVSGAGWLLPLEIVFLDLGLLLSLYTAYRLARERCPALPRALRLFAPWAVLAVLLFAAGVWLLFQPMEMRGTLL